MAEPATFGLHDRGHRSKPLLRTTLGDVLRRTRLGQGRTLADVARAARVSMPYLSELERGRKEASSEVLAAICEALRIELSDLLAEAGRELLAARGRVPIIRLGFNGSPMEPAPVAEQTEGPADPADLLAAPGEARQRSLISSPVPASQQSSPDRRGAAMCLLAA